MREKAEFALGELRHGRLPWVHWSVWLIAAILGVMVFMAVIAVGESVDEALAGKRESTEAWRVKREGNTNDAVRIGQRDIELLRQIREDI